MTNVKIVTDSSCTMDSDFKKRLGIHVIPLSVMIDGMIYKDDETLSSDRFMTMMNQSQALPKTSQPPIGEFIEMYDQLGEDGSNIISIHITETLSGTVETARQAAQISQSNVTVIDSKFTDQSLSFMVMKAAELAQAGANQVEIVAAVEKVQKNSKLYIGIATLDNLVKGGRVNRVTGMLSNLFNMKIVMELANGELIVQTKGRGMRTFNQWFDQLNDHLTQLPAIKKVGISYAGDGALSATFKEKIQNSLPLVEVSVLPTNSVIATHAGKGAFAIMYYTE